MSEGLFLITIIFTGYVIYVIYVIYDTVLAPTST